MPKTKTKASTDAVQAMQETLNSKQDKVVLQLSPEIRLYLKAFLRAFKEVRPDNPFSVLDIMGWARKYQAIVKSDKDPDFKLPSIFYNAYSLGKLLKKSQEELGLQSVGTYGNRAIYTAKEDVE